MNEPPDSLEAELSALRPQEMTPELRRRVAERLAEPAAMKHWRRWRIAMIGGMTAACVAAILVWRWSVPAEEHDRVVVRPSPLAPVTAQDVVPTLQTYQRALARSPEELDTLFDKQTLTNRVINEPVPVCTFMWSESALQTFLGEN